MGTMIDWNTRFQALPDAEKDKIALLRVIECSNGIIQYKFRDEDEDALIGRTNQRCNEVLYGMYEN
jgi:hypothetical protein